MTSQNSQKLISEYCTAYLDEKFDEAQKISKRLKILEPQSSLIHLMHYDLELKKVRKAFERVEQFEKSLVRFQNLDNSLGEAFKAQYRLAHNDLYTAHKILSKIKKPIQCFSEYEKILETYYSAQNKKDKSSNFKNLENYVQCQKKYNIDVDQVDAQQVLSILNYDSGLEYTKLEPIDYDRYTYHGKSKYIVDEPKKKQETEKDRLLKDLSNFNFE